MYSIVATLIASIFLAYGIYAIAAQGRNRSSMTFFAVCIAAALWQGALGVVAQFSAPDKIMPALKFGYVMTLFLPSCLFHFLTEIAERPSELTMVRVSYGISLTLAVFAMSTDKFVPGYYVYSWGYYGKAGPLHFLHAIQAVSVLLRGIYLCYLRQRNTTARRRAMLRLCMAGAFAFSFAALDDMCRYGIDIYPPGAGFVLLSLGAISVAIMKYKLLNSGVIAATMVHEMRTPLRAIRNRAHGIHTHFGTLLTGYRIAVEHGLCEDAIPIQTLRRLETIGEMIEHEVDRTSTALDMMLANIQLERIDKSLFVCCSIGHCITEALERYPFEDHERARVLVGRIEEFQFFGSDTLLILVLFNLLKNALYATSAAKDGTVVITTCRTKDENRLLITDTGEGVRRDVLTKIFDPFFTTKTGAGLGVGLAFCERVLISFDGRISCTSNPGASTTFTLEFPTTILAYDGAIA